MNNENDISYKLLQNYEVAPPAFLLSTIKSKIEELEVQELRTVFSPLCNNSITPTAINFDLIMQKIGEGDQVNVFKKLSQLEVQPPISFEALMQQIKALGYAKSSTATRVISFNTFKKIFAVAAILMLLIGGYFMFSKNDRNNNSIANNNPISLPINEKPGNNNLSNTDSGLINTNDLPLVENPENSTKKVNWKSSKNTYAKLYNKRNNRNKQASLAENNAPPTPLKMMVGGVEITVYDDDYLLTFASFSPDKLPPFLQAENPVETQITVDKYSYFNVTEGMGAMMKKMYDTKKSGGPTRSARKQKEKLEKWKAVDSAYFNQNSLVNPLDPRDLGNLILNK